MHNDTLCILDMCTCLKLNNTRFFLLIINYQNIYVNNRLNFYLLVTFFTYPRALLAPLIVMKICQRRRSLIVSHQWLSRNVNSLPIDYFDRHFDLGNIYIGNRMRNLLCYSSVLF